MESPPTSPPPQPLSLTPFFLGEKVRSRRREAVNLIKNNTVRKKRGKGEGTRSREERREGLEC